MCSATIRARTSIVPPAENGTIRVIGRVGKFCAAAVCAAAPIIAAQMAVPQMAAAAMNGRSR